MNTKDFYYDLPEELIAQDPLLNRSSSRLMLLDKETGEIEHKHFYEILDYLNPGDCLVLNETKVIPARLYGVKEDTGAQVEVLLLHRKDKEHWECLVKPGKKLKPGARISFGDGRLKAEIVDILEEGNRLIRFEFSGIFEEVLDQLGEMPLPLILPINWRTEPVTIPSMPRKRALRRLLRQDCIGPKNYWSSVRPRELRFFASPFM